MITKQIGTKGQTITEYAILLSIVIAAIAGMQVYVKRGLQARVKTGADAFTSISGTITGSYANATLTSLSQYEPYYVDSKGESYQESVKQEHMGGGRVVQEIVSEVAASAAGGYRAEGTDTAHDSVWDSAEPEPEPEPEPEG